MSKAPRRPSRAFREQLATSIRTRRARRLLDAIKKQPWGSVFEPEGARVAVAPGDCAEVLKLLPEASVDAIVTDPPAGIAFMGKEWDEDKGGRLEWIAWLAGVMRECLRALKPGGHALVWALPRTSHWTATALEDAGFEIRDVLHHLFGTGFPKSLDVSKAIDESLGTADKRPVLRTEVRMNEPSGIVNVGQGERTQIERRITAPASPEAARWEGWGTAVKPAAEHWILCRKPLEGSVAENVLAHGAGGLNIDGCRVPVVGEVIPTPQSDPAQRTGEMLWRGTEAAAMAAAQAASVERTNRLGRFPANVVLSHAESCELVGTRTVQSPTHYPAERGAGGIATSGHGGQDGLEERAPGVETVEDWRCAPGCPVAELDAQSGPSTTPASVTRGAGGKNGRYGPIGAQGEVPSFGDSGGASRFFYVAKPSTAERDGDVDWGDAARGMARSYNFADAEGNRSIGCPTTPTRLNTHPTVKPIALMRWLVRLVTPPGGLVLDPFAGSGTTLIAAVREGVRALGVEREPQYLEIIGRRLATELSRR